ncbi:MAG: helix-turn-helix domain-containing protein [Rhodothermaceae bacterium]|nr:helix-turn-helix domain-containing protein [Rhodothermaceae bacterium]MYD66800.1 helix-turn-helix domain-containing protein [Rhodothermaceae bacterium]MYJ08382.1 helix-turn-helix domain-containing protein [Rhodothermaceae bacterium]
MLTLEHECLDAPQLDAEPHKPTTLMIPSQGDAIPERAVITRPIPPAQLPDVEMAGACRQWQDTPGKYGGRLLRGRAGAPGKKPGLTNLGALAPAERNLEAEALIRDIQSALLLWQKDVTRGCGLSNRAVLVLHFLVGHCRTNPKGDWYLHCWHTVARIASSLMMSPKTVRRAVDDLKEAGILRGERERYENGKYGRRYFWILTPPDLTRYAPKSMDSPKGHITDKPVPAPKGHITDKPVPPLLEERRLEQISRRAEAENRLRRAECQAPLPEQEPPTGMDTDSADDRIQRLQHRLRSLINGLLPDGHDLIVWGTNPRHVQEAVREVVSGIQGGISPVKSLINLRRNLEHSRDGLNKADWGCRNIFPDHTHLSINSLPGVSEPTCPMCRGKQVHVEPEFASVDVSLVGRPGRGAASRLGETQTTQTKKSLRRKEVADRVSARTEHHQAQLRQILDPVGAKGDALYAWAMDPEHVHNALLAVTRGLERGDSPVNAMARLARSGDYKNRADQISLCRMVMGRAWNNATEFKPIDWRGGESWMDDVLQEVPELFYERILAAKAECSGKELFRGVINNISQELRVLARRERKQFAIRRGVETHA